jgi:Subtilase family
MPPLPTTVYPRTVHKLFACLLMLAFPLAADELSYASLQSGWASLATPINDHGIHGEGQIVAVLDTGLDYDSCFFAEPDGSAPPINTTLSGTTVDLSRRKVVAYDFLYSGDNPSNPAAYDNQGHGTHAAAAVAGDQETPIMHDVDDALATGAKLIVQDAGYTGGDNCSQRPGIGCPVNLGPILEQAYRQGARIHSNSWGDRQGAAPNATTPTANYPQSAYDVDAFVDAHPDMLVVFNTGNFGNAGLPPPRSLSAPGCAKNTLQVGGTRGVYGVADDTMAIYSLIGPTWDGRIKPDLAGPAYVEGADSDNNIDTHNCNVSEQPGTSWASPSIAGAAALVRQYYTEGWYPSGARSASNAIVPSAALLKATLIAAARQVPYQQTSSGLVAAGLVPSYTQGFGFPVLEDALVFAGGARKLHIADVATAYGLATGETATIHLDIHAGTPLKAVLVWTDPPGVVRPTGDSTPELVNDLDLHVTSPTTSLYGNDSLHPGQPDRLNNVEVVSMASPTAGSYTFDVHANTLGRGPRQGYALVITGDFAVTPVTTSKIRAVRH